MEDLKEISNLPGKARKNKILEDRNFQLREALKRKRMARWVGAGILTLIALSIWIVCQVIIGHQRLFEQDPELFNRIADQAQESK